MKRKRYNFEIFIQILGILSNVLKTNLVQRHSWLKEHNTLDILSPYMVAKSWHWNKKDMRLNRDENSWYLAGYSFLDQRTNQDILE
jgi:hypothetical protein